MKIWKDEMASMWHLVLAALGNFIIAFVHAVIPFNGVNAYIYFGTPDLALLESQGSSIPEIATWLLALVFAGFGLYCLSGAEIIRPLPLLNPALWFIGGIFTLRGLILFLDIDRYLSGVIYPTRQIGFSAVALTIGLLVLIGTWLRTRTPKTQ